MTETRSRRGWLLSLALIAFSASVARAETEEVALLNSVSASADATGVTLRIDLSHSRQPRFNEIDSPYRIFFDFPNTRLRAGQTLEQTLNHKLLKGFRLGQFSDEPPIARLVLDVVGKQGVKVATEDDGRVIFIGLGNGATRPEAPPEKRPVLDLAAMRWTEQTADQATLVLDLSQMAVANSFFMPDPDRIVIDLQGAALKATPEEPSRQNGLVRAVRAAQFEPDVVRIVLDLRSVAGHQLLKRLNPSRLEVRLAKGQARGRLVVIDPGHGGKDSGCSGYRAGLYEKNVVLDIGLRAAAVLRGKGVRVVMTRDDDTFIDLYERPQIANRLGADLFVSVHCNAMPESKKGQRSGTEIYYYTPQSESFASIMLQNFVNDVGLPARGTHQRRFVVVRYTNMPSVLVETGYLDHRGDGGKLDSAEFRQKCALGVVHGVMRYLERMPQGLRPIEAAAAPGEEEGVG